MSKKLLIQISISLLALILFLIHVFCPFIVFDTVALTLIVLIFLPWLAPLLKSIELPGGVKVELQEEFEKVVKEVEESGLTDNANSVTHDDDLFLDLLCSSPQLALAGLRIELEKSLKLLAIEKGVNNPRKSIISLMKELHNKEIISNQERAALMYMIFTLNKAVHGEEVEYDTAQKVMVIGVKVLNSLKKRLKNK